MTGYRRPRRASLKALGIALAVAVALYALYWIAFGYAPGWIRDWGWMQ